MKYQQRLQIEIVDEWRQCYINYSQLEFYLSILGACTKEEIYLAQQYKIQQLRNQPHETKSDFFTVILRLEISNIRQQVIVKRREEFKDLAIKINQMFVTCFKKNLELYNEFVEFKYEEIKRNFGVCKALYYLARDDELVPMEIQFRHYLEYIYSQSQFLAAMVRSNIEAQSRLIEKHNLFSHGLFDTPEPFLIKTLSIQKCSLLKREISAFYVESHKKTMNKSRDRIRRLATFIEYDRHAESLFIGLLSGIMMSVIIFMCIILARQKIVLEIDPIFNQYFPLWRGISFYIFYAWMLGTNLFYFERYKISHKIILENQFVHYPRSNDLFKIASFFSLVFIILFVIYALQLSEVIQTSYFAPQWLPLIIWGLFLLFMINPLPFLFCSGRVYIWKMLSKAITSIYYPADFLAMMVVTQLFALINAFQDTVYTICYYTTLNLPLPLTKTLEPERCRNPATIAKFVFTLYLYGIRAYHCARGLYMNWGKEVFYKTVDFQNMIKFLCGLTTAILSFLWTVANNAEVLPIWIIFAVITTIYSFIWDVRKSFDVLNRKSKNYLLRDEIIYPKFNYYCWTVATFILRCSWALYISPNIVKNFLGSPEIFLLVFGYMQIIRRGIWNTIRIELEQVRNREAFRAIPKEKDTIQDKIYDLCEKLSTKGQSVQILASGLIEEEDLEQAVSDKTRKQRSADVKKRLVKLAKEDFNQQLQKKLLAEGYKKELDEKVKELIEKVYN